MANEDDRTTVQGGSEEQPQTPAKSGGKSKLILLGGIGFAAIAIGIVVALFVVKPMMAGSGEGDATSEVTENEGGKEHSEKPKEEKKEKKKSEHGESVASKVYNIDDIVINPAGTGGTRFLSASFAFEIASEEAAKDFEAREAIVRDALITILSSKTIAQLTDVKQKEITRYQIKKRISEILNTEEVAGVFYTDFVLQ